VLSTTGVSRPSQSAGSTADFSAGRTMGRDAPTETVMRYLALV
jgi:hypothetical protein